MGQHIGIGMLSRKTKTTGPADTSLQPDAIHLFESGRWCRGAIPPGGKAEFAKRWLHVISLYNIAGSDRGIVKTIKECLLKRAFQDAAQIGEQPVLLCADASTSVDASPALKAVQSTGVWIIRSWRLRFEGFLEDQGSTNE